VSAPTANGVADVVPAKTPKPKRPRPDSLVYDQRELAYVLGMSIRTLRRKMHRLPAALPISRRPLWARDTIREWLANGAKGRR
jgi:hypothetical protein